MNKINFFVFLLMLVQSAGLAACTWCKPAKSEQPFSAEHFFMTRYFKRCYPKVRQLVALFPTMCATAVEKSMHRTIKRLGERPWKYFHLPRKKLQGYHLKTIVKEFKALTVFIRTHSVNPATKQIMPTSTVKDQRGWVSLFRHWQKNAAVDAHGCTVVDDLCAYYLSYIGTLFNSFALCPSLDYTFAAEQRKIRRCRQVMEALVNLLRSSPYQANVEGAWQNWERIYQQLERRFQNPITKIRR